MLLYNDKISNHIRYKCGMKLLIHSQTSTVAPLMFGNGWIIPDVLEGTHMFQNSEACIHGWSNLTGSGKWLVSMHTFAGYNQYLT